MALIIRLRQHGRRNRPFFRLVVADSRSPRDGKCIETLGWYDPLVESEERNVSVEAGRVQHWLDQGAQLSENVEHLMGRAAPELMKRHRATVLARRLARVAKRRARRKSESAAK